MHINPADLPEREVYKLMSGSILPRPIAWVSTINAAGQPNLAPFSFFNMVCADPPTLLFCPGIRGADSTPKDTLRNIRDTGEFVVNVVTESLANAMNLTSVEAPPDVNEFERAGLTTAASMLVQPPGVAESPIRFECKQREIVTISNAPGGGYIVIGTVVLMHIHESVYRDNNHIDLDAYQPVGRLSGTGYTRVTDRFHLTRPPSEILPRL